RGAEIARQPLGETQPRGRGMARADDGDRRQIEHGGLAAYGKKRRRVVDHLQPARIFWLPQRNESDAEGFRRLEFTLGILAGMDAGGTAPRPPGGGSQESRPGPPRAPRRGCPGAGKVRGPTLSLRMRQSQSSRCSSLSRTLSLLTG